MRTLQKKLAMLFLVSVITLSILIFAQGAAGPPFNDPSNFGGGGNNDNQQEQKPLHEQAQNNPDQMNSNLGQTFKPDSKTGKVDQGNIDNFNNQWSQSKTNEQQMQIWNGLNSENRANTAKYLNPDNQKLIGNAMGNVEDPKERQTATDQLAQAFGQSSKDPKQVRESINQFSENNKENQKLQQSLGQSLLNQKDDPQANYDDSNPERKFNIQEGSKVGLKESGEMEVDTGKEKFTIDRKNLPSNIEHVGVEKDPLKAGKSEVNYFSGKDDNGNRRSMHLGEGYKLTDKSPEGKKLGENQWSVTDNEGKQVGVGHFDSKVDRPQAFEISKNEQGKPKVGVFGEGHRGTETDSIKFRVKTPDGGTLDIFPGTKNNGAARNTYASASQLNDNTWKINGVGQYHDGKNGFGFVSDPGKDGQGQVVRFGQAAQGDSTKADLQLFSDSQGKAQAIVSERAAGSGDAKVSYAQDTNLQVGDSKYSLKAAKGENTFAGVRFNQNQPQIANFKTATDATGQVEVSRTNEWAYTNNNGERVIGNADSQSQGHLGNSVAGQALNNLNAANQGQSISGNLGGSRGGFNLQGAGGGSGGGQSKIEYGSKSYNVANFFGKNTGSGKLSGSGHIFGRTPNSNDKGFAVKLGFPKCDGCENTANMLRSNANKLDGSVIDVDVSKSGNSFWNSQATGNYPQINFYDNRGNLVDSISQSRYNEAFTRSDGTTGYRIPFNEINSRLQKLNR